MSGGKSEKARARGVGILLRRFRCGVFPNHPIDSHFEGMIYFQRSRAIQIDQEQAGRPRVKLENFSYNIVMKTLELLESQHHYKITETVKKEIAEAIIEQIDSLIES